MQVKVESKGWSCILDIRLALARYGAELALRLADEMRICLVPTLWDILDNSSYYEARPDALALDPLLPQAAAADSPDPDSLRQWELTRATPGLAARRIHWAGDTLHESSLPDDVDAGVIARFDRYGQSLEQRLLRSRPELSGQGPSRMLEGGVGALALAAAMSPYRPLVLTLADRADGEPPPLSRLLDWAGIHCRGLEAAESAATRAYMQPMLVRSSAMELLWAGLRLVVLHLAVPGAWSLPIGEDAALSTDISAIGAWDDAVAFYWSPIP